MVLSQASFRMKLLSAAKRRSEKSDRIKGKYVFAMNHADFLLCPSLARTPF